MTAVSDFDYDFGDEFEIPDVPDEVDTTTVEIVYDDVEEDTAYIDQQQTFESDVEAAAQTGQAPAALVDAGTAATEALDDEEEAEVEAIEQSAEQDPEATAASLDAALDDTTSQESQLAANVENAAAQQASLSSLLGLASTPGKASYRVEEESLPIPGLDDTSFDVTDAFGTLTCEDDAQDQFQQALGRAQDRFDQSESAIEQTYQNSVTKAENFRAQQLNQAAANRIARRQRAVTFFVNLRNAINTLAASGNFSDAQVRQWRIMNTVVLIVNLRKARTIYFARVTAVNAAADAALQAAQNKRQSQLNDAQNRLSQRRQAFQNALQVALGRCHDQGQTTG